MYKISLGARVRDRVMFEDSGKRLKLSVSDDAGHMVLALNKAKTVLKEAETAEDDVSKINAALSFASAIFGIDQAQRLFELYDGDPGSVVAACGKYFSERLAGKIADAQKRTK